MIKRTVVSRFSAQRLAPFALSLTFAACGGGTVLDPVADIGAEQVQSRSSAPVRVGGSGSTSNAPGNSGNSNGSGSKTSDPSTTSPTGPLRWSDTATWGGKLPGAGADIVVPAGRTILLDTNPPPLGALRIEGALVFDQRDISLAATSISVAGGALRIGSPGAPFTHKAVITLTGAPGAINDGASRGLNVVGGGLELYGATPSPAWAKINEHAAAGTKALTLATSVDWLPGSTLSIAPTDFYKIGTTQRVTATQVNGAQINLAEPLAQSRWGRLQYVTSAGMSLSPEPGYVPPATPAPTVLDERAVVANLSRQIVIQGADDASWQNSGFGAHVMIMDLKSKVVVDGVEFRRVGQAGVLARYPFHWHMLSYAPGTGQMIGDATGHVLRNSAIWNSANRCVVVHGTNGVLVQNNICQDIKGHAFFMEDGSERRNVFEGNLALTMRPATLAAHRLQVHETEIYQAGPSGFWLTNPDNTVRNNHAADATGNGFWMAFPKRPLGLSASVPIQPLYMKHGVFEYNTAHSNRGPGILLEFPPIDSAGNVLGMKYVPLSDENGTSMYDVEKRLRFTLKGVVSFKNLEGAYRNRVSNPDYVEWVSADNVGTHMAGAGDDGLIERGLFVGTSLNNATPVPLRWDGISAPAAFASYNSTFNMRHNTVVNFPFVEGKISGMLQTDDYYIHGIDKGTARHVGNRLLNSSVGYRTLPPHLDGKPLERRHWTLSGAIWDPEGLNGPKENFWVYDVPFLTAGANCQWVAPAGKNGKSCGGQYYGVSAFQTDFDQRRYEFAAPIQIVRIDEAGSEIGRWDVADGNISTKLGMMRNFAAMPGARYILRFPGNAPAKQFAMSTRNLYRSTDSFVMAISFDGAVNAAGYTLAGQEHRRDDPKTWPADSPLQQHVRWFQPATSLSEVASSTGNKLWQDRTKNLVWVKVQGGLPYVGEAALNVDPQANLNDQLYRPYSVVIYPK